MKISLLALLCLLVLSCTSEQPADSLQTIKIDLKAVRSVKLSELVEELRYVPLQTPGIPLGEGLVKIKKQYIYYWDLQQKQFFVFDHKGQFIANLDKVGQGPGEYSSPIHFEVDEEEEIVEIWDSDGHKIIQYSLPEFSYLAQYPEKGRLRFTDARKLENGDYLISTNQALNFQEGKVTNADFFLTDSLGQVKQSYFDKVYKAEDPKNYVSYSLFSFKLLDDDNGNIYGSMNFNDKLYHFENDEFNPVLRATFAGGKSLDNQALLEMSKREQLQYFTQSDEFINTASFPNFEINTSQVLMINYLFRERLGGTMDIRNFIWFKNSNEKFHAKKIENDLTSFPKEISLAHSNSISYIHCDPWFDGQFVSVVSPETELDYGTSIEVAPLGSVKATDNPILIFMKVKKPLLIN